MSLPVKEGEIPYDVPAAGKQCTTWYKIVGDISTDKTPLILLHGGPGACHEYLLPFTDLTRDYGIPTIFYDQIGNGKSTRLKEKNGDTKFWTPMLFHKELDNLIDNLRLRESGFDILGQSWGGMLGSSYATLRPRGLRRLIIANSPASMDLWVKSGAQLLMGMPQNVQDTIRKCEEALDLDRDDYKAAIAELYVKHLCRVKPYPAPECKVAIDHLEEDSTTYMTMNGPSELTVTGNLRNWTIVDELHKIKASTLVYNGEHDEAQDICVFPYFEKIPKVKWVVIEGTSHFTHVERRERTMKLVGEFLKF